MKKIRSVTAFTSSKAGMDESAEGYKSSYIEYDLFENVICSATFNAQGEMESKTTCIYNEKGKLMEETNYVTLDEIGEQSVYSRDENGLVTGVKVEYADGSVSLKKYERNNEENSLTVTILNEEEVQEGKEYRRFNSNNDIIEEINYNDEGKVEDKIIREYDEKNLLVRRIEYDNNDELVMDRQYFYSEQGNLVKITGIDRNGKPAERIEIVYDEKNRVVEQQIKNSMIIRYEYDDEKHTTTEKRYNPHGILEYEATMTYNEENQVISEDTPLSVIRYEYEYYENT